MSVGFGTLCAMKNCIDSSTIDEKKVAVALSRIRLYCQNKKTLVAFSGGKDSQCCYHLCKQAGIEFSAQLSLTRFEPPEVINFVRAVYPDVSFRRAYKRSLTDEIVYRGLPTRWARWCCNYKHTKTADFEIAVIGVRGAESPRRRDTWRSFGHKPDGSLYVCPIFDWSDADVWGYLNQNKIPHCSLYDEGFKRIGCVCCPLACTKSRRDEYRWPKTAAMLYRAFERHWASAVERGGVTRTGKPFRMLGWGSPQVAFAHWLKTGSTNFVEGEEPPAPAPCAFAGTGFSESDAQTESDDGE